MWKLWVHLALALFTIVPLIAAVNEKNPDPLVGAAFFGLIWAGFTLIAHNKAIFKSKPEPSPVTNQAALDEIMRQKQRREALEKANALPPAVKPQRATGPVQGLMRVDVTQTEKSVDIFIELSEQAKTAAQKLELTTLPIEEHLEGLSKYLAEQRAARKDIERKIDNKTKAEIAGLKDSTKLEDHIHRQSLEMVLEMSAADRSEREERAVEHDTREYKREHTVTLGQYLQNPYRRRVGHPIEVNNYLAAFENEYLPRIKAILEKALVTRDTAPRSYDV